MTPGGDVSYYMYLMCQEQRLSAEAALSSDRHLTACLYVDSTGRLVSRLASRVPAQLRLLKSVQHACMI
jgi:hypothetical protein